MKKIKEMTAIQAVACMVFSAYAILSLIGIFFNPVHIMTFLMSVIVARAIYKYW